MAIIAKIKRWMDSVSTHPNKRNWKWNNATSPLAWSLLHLIYILRALSLLQILKKAYRSFKERKNKADRDVASKRVNVPPKLVELYFLSFIVLLLFIYWCSDKSDINILTSIICIYFLLESSVWVLYYFVLRRFFEEKYAIMHALEYILLIPIVIIGQGLCLALIHGLPFFEGVHMILSPDSSTPNYICILNILYIAVVIGVVISTLPTENVKEKGRHKYDISIIGAGDVVVNRLIPALKKTSNNLNVAIYDINKGQEEKKEKINGNDFAYKIIDDNFRKNILNSNLVWIATPSQTHLSYLEEFIGKDIFIVIEKPLTSLKAEYTALTKLLKSNGRNKVFCLSYYYLEKALPLVYLFNPMVFYEKYLLFSQNKSRSEILAAFSLLGSIKEVQIYLFEQNDERTWVKNNMYGGQYMETFIHVALLNKMIFGEECVEDNLKWTLGDYKKDYKTTYIECIGKVKKADFSLYMGKFMPVKKREGTIVYENGKVYINFETSICQCTFYKDSSLNFSVSFNNNYPKYGVLYDMVERCCKEDIPPSIIDGSELQLKTQEWLFSQDLSKIKHFDYDEETDKDFFKAYKKAWRK